MTVRCPLAPRGRGQGERAESASVIARTVLSSVRLLMNHVLIMRLHFRRSIRAAGGLGRHRPGREPSHCLGHRWAAGTGASVSRQRPPCRQRCRCEDHTIKPSPFHRIHSQNSRWLLGHIRVRWAWRPARSAGSTRNRDAAGSNRLFWFSGLLNRSIQRVCPYIHSSCTAACPGLWSVTA
jgi:hypothetical protein